MKRMLSIGIVVVMILSTLALTACGGGKGGNVAESRYVGTWKALSMSLGETSENLDNDWTLTLNADGTGTLASAEEATDFTWELTDKGFKTQGGMKMTFTDDGDNIKSKIIGVDLTFEKQ